MARNGTDFGIRVASMPDRWGLLRLRPLCKDCGYPVSSEKDANPDIGDSSITETGEWLALPWLQLLLRQIRRR
jgi:hypothetical protein